MLALREINADERRAAEAEASIDAFSRCVERVESVIREEMVILKRGGKIDFDALNQRKSHALLEFLRFSKVRTTQNGIHSAQRMQSLQRLLADNAELLSRRLQATEEITGLIVRHIRDSESDGTYSIRSPKARQR